MDTERLVQRHARLLHRHELKHGAVLNIAETDDQLLTPTSPVSVETSDLTVRFRRTTALDRVDLKLTDGVTGLLGPNGAGKTTLLSVLATVLRISAGSATVGGHDVKSMSGRRAARRLVGWLPQRFDLAGSMTVQDTVRYAAWSNGIDIQECEAAAANALSAVDLTDRAGDRVRRLSGGQRQRLGLAAALAHRPRIVLLDEPTSGLDPAQRVRFRTYVRAVGRGRTVLLATHLLDDVHHVCDHLVVLSRGRVAFDGLPSALADLGGKNDDALESSLERGYRRVLGSVSAEPA